MERRNTKQRQSVFEVINGKGKHMTADQVYAELAKSESNTIGLATVYRNLNLLYAMGKIGRVTEKDIVYFDGNPEPHDHLRCVECGTFMDVDLPYDASLDKKMEAALGKPILRHTTIFDTLCDNCRKKTKN